MDLFDESTFPAKPPLQTPEPLPQGTREEWGRLVATEERLSVRIEEREAGAVRVRTVTHKALKDVPVVLRNKEVRVERLPVYRFVDAEFAPRQEGDTWVVPVFEYVPVTEMRLMLKEEIHIISTVNEEESVHQAEVQRQEVIVERRVGDSGQWNAEMATEPRARMKRVPR
jgi:stress response protein YsnF